MKNIETKETDKMSEKERDEYAHYIRRELYPTVKDLAYLPTKPDKDLPTMVEVTLSHFVDCCSKKLDEMHNASKLKSIITPHIKETELVGLRG